LPSGLPADVCPYKKEYFDECSLSDIIFPMAEKRLKLDWLSIGEAAEYLGVSRDTLRRWEKRGKLKSYRTPGGRRRYTAYDLELALKPPKTVPNLIPQKKEEPIKEPIKEEAETAPRSEGGGVEEEEKEKEETVEARKKEPPKKELPKREEVPVPKKEEEKKEAPTNDLLKEILKNHGEMEEKEAVKESKRPFIIKVASLSLALIILSAVVLPATLNLVLKLVSAPEGPLSPVVQQEVESPAQEEEL
jgi:excisionase family DNA binding protein